MELSQSRIAARRLLSSASQGNPDSARPETALAVYGKTRQIGADCDSLPRHCQVNWHTDECRRPGGADEASRRLADTGLLSPDLKRLGTSAPIADCRHEVASQSEMTVDYRVRR